VIFNNLICLSATLKVGKFMPKVKKRSIAVFLASPNDLSAEREWFKETVYLLNTNFNDVANVEFEPLCWEYTLAATGRRPQGLINTDIDRCDVFILMMYRRWGQVAPDAAPYSSYTEEEFYRALARYEKTGAPEIFVFFKRVDAASEADPGPQLEKVLSFRRLLEEGKQVLYRYFDNNKQSFIAEIENHLRAYIKGELVGPDKANKGVILPLSVLEEVNKTKVEAAEQTRVAEEAKQMTEAVYLKVKVLQLQSAEEAAYLAREGQLELARKKFVEVIADTSNLQILFLAYEFFYRTGDLNTAVDVLVKWLSVSGHDKATLNTAAAYGNLGNIHSTRGNLNLAEEMHKKALTINEALGHKKGMAIAYGNIGNICRLRGKLDLAEEANKKALAINETLNHKEGMADDYGNLGTIYSLKDNLDLAEIYFKKSLSINSSLDRKEKIAVDYLNLGNVYLCRDQLDCAEAMFNKALSIDEALNHLEGMANNYGSLGNVYIKRNQLDCAVNMFKKALATDENLGRLEGMANNYVSLGGLSYSEGNVNQAKAFFNKALELFNATDSPMVKDVEKWIADL